MNTSLPLLNVITGSQAATGSRSANPADSFSADVPFNQVLNSQVSTRNKENQSQDKPQAAQEQSAPPSQPTQSASSTSSAKASAANGNEQKQAKDEDKDSDDDTTTQASAELLALVANIAQSAVKPVTEGKSENTDADLLAQAKRGGAKLSLADEQQALAGDGKDGKADLAGLQSSLAANKGKFDGTATELARKANAAEANPADAHAAKSDKPAVDLGTEKALPKEDASTLANRAQYGKATTETVAAAKQDLPQTTPTPVVMPAVQQALAANQTQAVFGTTYTDKIQPNVGSAGWDQAVGNKITWMATGGIQSASLTLNPPDLGPMQVVLNVHNQQADATFITAQPEVKQALEAAMPRLREMMDQAGIQLGQATVNTGMPNQQQGANGGQQQSRSTSGAGNGGQDQDGEITVAGAATATTTSGLGLVDTFA